MRSHTLEVLGLEVSFKAEADPRRIERARALLEERCARLSRHGKPLSKEKLLTFLALSLADDVLLLQDERGEYTKRMQKLLANMETLTE
ncbi:MAG: cell division protein ZapA [Desulfovibrio sp.]|jgi:cell division protein ZapA|nr:cell division protein ZapA [Desulfovibrio sp.]